MGAIAIEPCKSPYKEIDLYAFITAASLFYVLNSLFIIKFLIFKYYNRKRMDEREVEYNSNTLAKRARIKSIFQTDDVNFDETTEID